MHEHLIKLLLHNTKCIYLTNLNFFTVMSLFSLSILNHFDLIYSYLKEIFKLKDSLFDLEFLLMKVECLLSASWQVQEFVLLLSTIDQYKLCQKAFLNVHLIILS